MTQELAVRPASKSPYHILIASQRGYTLSHMVLRRTFNKL